MAPMARVAHGRSPLFVATLLSLSSIACVTAQAIAPDDPSRPLPAARDEVLPINIDGLAHEVATVRRLSLQESIHARALADDPFKERLVDNRAEAPRSESVATTSFWSAFLFAPSSTGIRDVSRRVVEEQVAGFYDPAEKALFLRGGAGDGRRIFPETDRDERVLAHEIEHALQDQHFGLGTRKTRGSDASLAYRALIEGDASLTEIAVRLQRRPGTDHWVSRVIHEIRSTPASELLRRGGVKSRELDAAPLLLQRTLLFPYREGLAFVADLYRAGGLKLIDRAFAEPPRSTEQVLHPDRYLAGDEPVVIPPPSPPDGWTLRATDTMGELATSVLLGQCVAREVGVKDARGWGGDAFAVVGDGGGRQAILWSTVWDDEEAAARFEADAIERGDCLRGKTLEQGLGGDVVVRRRGRRVAYVQGLGATAEVQAFALLSVEVETPPLRPPFGAITIPPLVVPEDAFLHQGDFDHGAWESVPLGMRMALPEDFVPDHGSRYEAAMKHGGDAQAAFELLMRPPTKETDEPQPG